MSRRRHGQGDKPNKHYKNENKRNTETEQQNGNKFKIMKTGAALLCLGIACSVAYKGYLETRVNTPIGGKKVVEKSGLAVPEMYWGSYRPQNYFGMKTREPYSPIMGLMWQFPAKLHMENTRHWCNEADNLRYTWTHHDGKSFGVQRLDDGLFRIDTSFLKRIGGNNGGDWTARISVTPKADIGKNETVLFIFYAAIEPQTKGRIKALQNPNTMTAIVGETQELGPFVIRFNNISGIVQYESFLSVEANGIDLLLDTILSTERAYINKATKAKHYVLPGDLTTLLDQNKANFIAIQLEARVPFTFDAIYESSSFIDRPNTLTGDTYSALIEEKIDYFCEKFENTFGLKDELKVDNITKIAKSIFSNLIGGIGYFYGSSKVSSEYTKGPVPYWKAPLYTAVPSRSFFPRGFLWDEGFHGLLISKWDLDIELDIISHWFDLMNVEGWIPREQILGVEAAAKVPDEFVVQKNTNANPPTFFKTLKFIMRNFKDKLQEENRLAVLERLYPRLVSWFDWFNSTQNGILPGSYRWRGRDMETGRELNPKTLTSGLDDYPRASHPTIEERHLDLYCWIILGAETLAELAKLLNKDPKKYVDTYLYLSDMTLLDSLHWSEEEQRYSDYGLHTDDVVLKKPPPLPQNKHSSAQSEEKKRVVLTDPKLRYVDKTFGYVSLFPLFLHLLPSNSPKLSKILTDIRNPSLLWTDYGLRSLAKVSPLYLKYNTEHDPPYWRGNIWININYLTLEALNHYSKLAGPYRNQAKDLYNELRLNLITNMIKVYRQSGYVWEHYNDKTGQGQGTRPFTGWSSLVVLIMGEIY